MKRRPNRAYGRRVTEKRKAVHRLRQLLLPPAAGLLAEYFDKDGPFAGETFDVLGCNTPDRVGPDDLFAVSMLAVAIRPHAARQLLGGRADEVSKALAPLPTDLDLWEASTSALDGIDEAENLLQDFAGFGPVISSKLLSRKRPRLVPIFDQVVLNQLGQPNKSAFQESRRAVAAWLCDAEVQHRLMELREPLSGGVSPLRVLDVVCWMRGSDSRNAKLARSRHGLSAAT